MNVATRCVFLLALAAGSSIFLASEIKSDRPPERSAANPIRLNRSVHPKDGKAAAALRALPLSFEPNVGQPRGDAELVGRGPGTSVMLTTEGIVLGVGASSSAREPQLRIGFGAGRLNWRGKDPLRGKTNYFIGKDPRRWRTNVPHFAAAEAAIGLAETSRAETKVKVYGGSRGIEYDLIVPPGADPSKLRIRLGGSRGARLDSRGNLHVQMGAAEVVMLKPVVYEEPPQATPRYTIRRPRKGGRGPKVRTHRSENPTAHARR